MAFIGDDKLGPLKILGHSLSGAICHRFFFFFFWVAPDSISPFPEDTFLYTALEEPSHFHFLSPPDLLFSVAAFPLHQSASHPACIPFRNKLAGSD